jgi:hypothetical protein
VFEAIRYDMRQLRRNSDFTAGKLAWLKRQLRKLRCRSPNRQAKSFPDNLSIGRGRTSNADLLFRSAALFDCTAKKPQALKSRSVRRPFIQLRCCNTIGHVEDVVQARLDRHSQTILKRLVARFGWTPSQAVREGLRLLDARDGDTPAKRVIGVGRFASRVKDLGSNKTHLRGFGW